jgi:UDP-N-acetylglucosamine/UDP-N-acetylgalactosamine 4-epimerase
MQLSPAHSNLISTSKFLVTGGAGFIGSHIAEYLLNAGAKKVRILDNLSAGYMSNMESFAGHPNFEFVKGDIRDLSTCKGACEGMDYVSHQAALGSVPRSIDDPLTTNEVNITGHLNMLVSCREMGVKRMVYAASSSTYGDSKVLPKKEDVIGKPLSPYAVTKYVNELYADVFYKTYGLETIGLRYFNVFGPRQNPNGPYAAVIPLFIIAILENKPPYINGDGWQTRDFTYVANAVHANIKALVAADPSAINEVYNIAVGEQTSLNQLFSIIVDAVGAHDIKPVYREGRKGDVRDSLADIEKAEKFLAYNPSVKIEEGLIKTIEWYKKITGN